MTATARFKQADLIRAANGLKACGYSIGRLEISPDGKIVIIPGLPETVTSDTAAWEQARKDFRDMRRKRSSRKEQ